MPDDVGTPGDAGEGAEATGGLYDLASVPEDLRPHVEPHLKAIEANITKKLQENAESLKAWEPYKELGISDIDPSALSQLLEFAELAQDEGKFSEWWKETGERMGLFPDPEGEEDFDLEDDLTPDKIKELISQAVTESIGPVKETLSKQETERAQAEAMAEINQTLAALSEEHGIDLDEVVGKTTAGTEQKVRDAILQLAYAYADDDPDNAVSNGFADFQRLVGKGEAGLFAKKAKQPAPPEGAGAASNAPEKITTFDQAKAAALDRLRADRAATA